MWVTGEELLQKSSWLAPYLTSLNRVKNFMFPESLFQLLYLCNNLPKSLVIKITTDYVRGFCGSRIRTWYRRDGWTLPQPEDLKPELESSDILFTHLAGKGQTSEGWIAGAP